MPPVFYAEGDQVVGLAVYAYWAVFIIFSAGSSPPSINENAVHWLMGLSFGMINLTYGVYLKLTLEPMETE